MSEKPSLSIYGLTGCAGDQLTILNCEDELLEIFDAVDIHSFVMAQTGNVEDKVDVALVEGSVTQPHDKEHLLQIRENCKMLVAIGTCAVWGGVNALRNDADRRQLINIVYGPENKSVKYREPAPLSAFVHVDYAIPGCPVEKSEILHALACLAQGVAPVIPNYSVCHECKIRENRCLLMEDGAFCMGPITRGGCGSKCPNLGRPCIGCRGPVADANILSEAKILREKGYGYPEILRRLQTFAYPANAVNEVRKKFLLDSKI